MRKLVIVFLALVVALPLVAGDVDNASVSLSGDATTKFGIDLDTNATGFTNSINAKVQLNFGLDDTAIGSGSDEGDIYGEVKIDEIEIKTTKLNDSGAEVGTLVLMDIDLEYAKLMGPGWWVSVKGADDTVDYEEVATGAGATLGITSGGYGNDPLNNVENDNGATGGFEAGIDIADAAEVQFSLYSLTPWTSMLDTSDDNAYGAKIEASLTAVDNLTFKAAMNMGFGATETTTLNDDMGFGALVGYDVAVNDDITITPTVGLDVKMLDAGGMDMAIGNGLMISLPGDSFDPEDILEDDAGNVYGWDSDDGIDSGINIGWSYGMPDGADPTLGFLVAAGIGMVENLAFVASFEASDLLADSGNMGFGAYGEYTIGDITPYAGAYMVFDNEDNGGWDAFTLFEAGLSYNIFPHTYVLVDYHSGNLAADDSGDEADPGLLTIGLKVKY